MVSLSVDPEVTKWYKNPKVTADGVPHSVKAHIIRTVAAERGITTFVETGTGYGLMLSQIMHDFERIYSCELYALHYEFSALKFADSEHVTILHGDSGEMVAEILKHIDEPVLFFLDAHYSGPGTAQAQKDTPIIEELTSILTHEHKHVIIVDDARLFGTDPAYPMVEDVVALAGEHGYEHCQLVADEILIYTEKEQ